MVYSRSLSELPGILQTFGKACLQHSSTLSYMTYLPLYHYIFKIVLFQIMLNFLYIFLIYIIF